MSHQKLLNSLLRAKQQPISNQTPVPNQSPYNKRPPNQSLYNQKPVSKSNNKEPSLQEMMSLLNMFDPNKMGNKQNGEISDIMNDKKDIIDKVMKGVKNNNENDNKNHSENNSKKTGNEDELEDAKKLDKMYVKKTDENPNKYLFCDKTNMYLPSGYRYAGYHTSRQTKQKTFLYTRKDDRGLFVVHCLGKKIDTHNNYDVYQQINITAQLPCHIIKMVSEGKEITL